MADPIPAIIASGTAATATVVASFSAQTAGKMMWLFVGSNDYRLTSGSNRPESSGWTLAQSGEDFNGWYLWYKTSTGAETSVTYSIGSADQTAWLVASASDVATTSPFGVSSALHTHGGGTSSTTAVTPTAGTRWVVIACLGAYHSGSSSVGAPPSLTNSYTLLGNSTNTAGTNVVCIGYRVLDGGTSTNTVTGSWATNAPQCSYGFLAAFAVATATVAQPIVKNSQAVRRAGNW